MVFREAQIFTSKLIVYLVVIHTYIYADDILPNHAQDSNPYYIDYRNLDRKYYPYIKTQNKYYDKDIIEIMRNANIKEQKSGFFIGIMYGGNINFNPAIRTSTITIANTLFNPLLFGLRVGYQDYNNAILYPSYFGYQVYIDIMASFGANGAIVSGINMDFLYDFFEKKHVSIGLSIGLGFGSARFAGLRFDNFNHEFAYKINFGFNVFLFHNHKINLIINASQGVQTGLIGVIPMIGYDYVF